MLQTIGGQRPDCSKMRRGVLPQITPREERLEVGSNPLGGIQLGSAGGWENREGLQRRIREEFQTGYRYNNSRSYVNVVLSHFLHITFLGLDPAGPQFELNPLLTKNSGDFVDVIHTNVMMQGDVKLSGHVDFYVNKLIYQDGCGCKKING